MMTTVVDLKQFSTIVAAIHDTTTDIERLKHALEILRAAFDASCAVAIIKPVSTGDDGLSLVASRGPGQATAFNQSLAKDWPFPPIAPLEVATVTDLVNEEVWLNSDFYRNVCAPSDVRDILCIELRLDDRSAYRLRFIRGSGAPRFGDAERELAQLLVPHLKLAFRLHQQLACAAIIHRRYTEAWERLGVATLVLDQAGCMIEANATAEALLATHGELTLRRSRLFAIDPASDRALQAILKRLLRPAAAGSTDDQLQLLSVRGDGTNLTLMVQRVADAEGVRAGRRRPAVVVFVRDPDQVVSDSMRAPQALFDLTETESALAMNLVNGLTLPQAAEQMHIRHSTARSHLRSIFAKTGVSRQSLLVRQVLNSVAALAADGAHRPH